MFISINKIIIIKKKHVAITITSTPPQLWSVPFSGIFLHLPGNPLLEVPLQPGQPFPLQYILKPEFLQAALDQWDRDLHESYIESIGFIWYIVIFFLRLDVRCESLVFEWQSVRMLLFHGLLQILPQQIWHRSSLSVWTRSLSDSII